MLAQNPYAGDDSYDYDYNYDASDKDDDSIEINKKFPVVDWTQIRKIVRNRSWKYLLNRRTDA